MTEKRKTPRRRTLKAGTIALDHGGTISCTVRNISEGGASLEVESPIGIPDNFKLVIEKDYVNRPCRVVSRTKNTIGVIFTFK